jgi:hypothetical protein
MQASGGQHWAVTVFLTAGDATPTWLEDALVCAHHHMPPTTPAGPAHNALHQRSSVTADVVTLQ